MLIGEFMVDETYFLWTALISGPIALCYFALAVYSSVKENRMKKMEYKVRGEIIGLVKSHLFRNETHGEVSGGALLGWGVAQGEQYGSRTINLRIPPWFPCVRYEVDGKVYEKITGEGVWKGNWKVGQQVTVLFEKDKPRICFIEEDLSYKQKCMFHIIVGCVATVLCVASILILMYQ